MNAAVVGRHVRALTIGTCALVTGVGCSWAEQRLKRLHDSLRLTVAVPEHIASGSQTLRVTLGVKNVSSESLEVCIGRSRTVVVDVGGRSPVFMSEVHPEGCDRLLNLASGAESTWEEVIQAPADDAGNGHLEIAVPIGETSLCLGCGTTRLEGRARVTVD